MSNEYKRALEIAKDSAKLAWNYYISVPIENREERLRALADYRFAQEAYLSLLRLAYNL